MLPRHSLRSCPPRNRILSTAVERYPLGSVGRLMPSTESTIDYKPPRWLRGGVMVTCFLFVILVLAAILLPGMSPIVLWVGIAGVVVGVGGVAEVWVGRVTLEPDCVVITQWFRTERVPLSDIAAVSLEGGYTSLQLRTGSWKRLPEWIGANRSLGRRIRDRLERWTPGQQ